MPATRKSILETWRKGQRILNQCWNIWKNQYILQLRNRYEVEHKQGKSTHKQEPKIGELVHINELTRPTQWKMGKIVEVHTNSENKIISATIKSADGSKIKRSIKFLSPMELPPGECCE